MKTTTELFVTAYYSKEDSICLWLTGAWLFNCPLGRSLSRRKVLGKLIHWTEIYLVDNIIHVLNNWGQAVTYKNDKKFCCLNNDRNNSKYELNDVNDKNNIILFLLLLLLVLLLLYLLLLLLL